MNANQFSQQLRLIYNRTAQLYQRSSATTWDEPELLADSLTELRIALEELQVAEEELLQQNQELAIAHTQLEVERQRYHDLFEFAPDGYLVTNTAGIIQEANRAAAKLLNVSQEKLIGKPLINYIPYAERKSFRANLNQLHHSDGMQEWEIRVSPRDSAAFDAAMTLSTVRDWQGKPAGWRWLLRNITARKQAEEQIRNMQLQNLQLQEVARLKSHFLAIMSHELRSPMNAILGFAQLLLRNSSHELAPKQENMVERILNSGRHMLRLIDDILDFSKLDAGGVELKLEELNVAELVRTTTEELLSLTQQKNLALQVQINIQNPYIINDSNRLRQVLVNLLSNAIKFTDCGSVEVKVWELSSDRLAIAVKDSGIGIAEADIEHIFQEFRQLNQTITRQHGGTGLGLAIVDRLVRTMQGKITVESTLGQGSTFCVELPRQVSSE